MVVSLSFWLVTYMSGAKSRPKSIGAQRCIIAQILLMIMRTLGLAARDDCIIVL